MIKKCVVLDGVIINIGSWDYQIGDDGVLNNPLPIGAITEDREFEYDADYGWREVGALPQATDSERITATEEAINTLITMSMM